MSITSEGPQMERIREQFPALRRLVKGQSVAYFDGPGGTQVPTPVVEAMADYLYHHNANTHWNYQTSQETDALLLHARQAGADLFHCTPEEIIFGQNMTTLTFHLARAMGRTWQWGPGDEIVVTELDHQANVAPWEALAAERGLTLRVARMIPETGTLDLADLERCLSGRTRLVAVGAASNALGTITDVARVVQLAKACGALSYVDAVHYAAHGLVDVAQWDCDVLVASAYKFYGPHIGIGFARRELLERLDTPKLIPAPDTAPERVETGTLNHEGMVGAGAAIGFIASLGQGVHRRAKIENAMDWSHRRGQLLVTRLWNGLADVSGVTLFGQPPHGARTPTVSFVLNGVTSDDLAGRLSARGIFVSHGDFYASVAVERLGIGADGLVRVGCACYTTEHEVDRVVEAVAEIARAA